MYTRATATTKPHHVCVACQRIFHDEKGLKIHYRKSSCSSAISSQVELEHQNNPNYRIEPETTTIAHTTNENSLGNTEEEPYFTMGGNDNDSQNLPDVLTTERSYEQDNIDHLSLPSVPTVPTVDESTQSDSSSTNVETSVDESSLTRYIDHVIKKQGTLNTPTSYPSDLELLYILQSSNVPMSMYDKIQNWARKSYAINQTVFTRAHMTRNKVLQLIEKKFDASGSYPIPSMIFLPSAKRCITIQTYDFSHAVYSLLTDPILMREENLDLDVVRDDKSVNPLYPFPMPGMYSTRSRAFEYKEFTDGELYCIAYNNHCQKNPSYTQYLHLPLIIIAQLDKTFIDSKGKLTLEPLKISLHIFKEKVRRLDIAWRPLGYISNQANLPKYKQSKDKASDYHCILAEIMKSFKEYQDTYDVFLWDMNIRQTLIRIAFKPVFGYIIGDNEGHDKTCGKFLNRMNVRRLCRCCDTPLEQSDNPFYTRWKHTSGPHIAKLVSNNQVETLRDMSYHCIHNAMSGIIFADTKRGINGATPAERLHLLNHGLFQLILEYNFGQKRAKMTRKNLSSIMSKDDLNGNPSNGRSSNDDGYDSEDSSSTESETDDDLQQRTHVGLIPQTSLSNVSLFTTKMCDTFDSDAKEYGRILQKQSSRYWNRSFFYQGITSNSKKVGHEERNCLLLCLLIYTSSRHEEYSSALDPGGPSRKRKSLKEHNEPQVRRLDYLIELISETLLLEQFMLQKKITKATLMLVEKYIPHYLQFLKEVCHRESGMGWKLTKFHILLHMVSDIQRLSIPINFDSNIVESHHKQEKKSGNRTQLRASLLEKQTAIRRTEHMLIERAYNQTHPPCSLVEDKDFEVGATNQDYSSHTILSSMKMTYVQHSGLFFTNSKGMPSGQVSQFPENPVILEQINEFLSELFGNTQLPSNGCPVYTRMSNPTQQLDDDDQTPLYRGDPFWSSRHVGDTVEGTISVEGETEYDPWHDFAYVRWRTTTTGNSDNFVMIPARIIFFWKFQRTVKERIRNQLYINLDRMHSSSLALKTSTVSPPLAQQQLTIM